MTSTGTPTTMALGSTTATAVTIQDDGNDQNEDSSAASTSDHHGLAAGLIDAERVQQTSLFTHKRSIVDAFLVKCCLDEVGFSDGMLHVMSKMYLHLSHSCIADRSFSSLLRLAAWHWENSPSRHETLTSP